MTALLERLGVASSKAERRRMRELLKRRRIDTSHWCHSPTRWYTDEELKAAIACSTSYAGVLRVLGVPQAGGSQAYLARRIRASGFDTAHFVGQAHRRGTRAPRRAPAEVLVVLPPGSPRPKAAALRAAMIAEGVAEMCALCGCDGTWLGNPLRLVIDHINGDWLDNRLENVRFLCPNCHAQTSTWCRRRTAHRQLPSGTEGS